MTLPETSPPFQFPVATSVNLSSLPQPPATFALGWLLKHGSAAIQYRSLVDVASLPLAAGTPVERLAYASRQCWELLYHQRPDGTWGHGMLTVPPSGRPSPPAIGGILAYRRLIELGLNADSPPMATARRALFRLLPEDNDPSYLYELAGDAGADPILIARGRQILREAAAAALAQAGYEADPRLRGAARRILDRVGEFLRTPDSDKPFIRVGNQHVLPVEAAPPSFHTLVMLAHMPHFRSEHHDHMERLFTWLSLQLPRMAPVQQVGETHLLEQPHLVLGDILPTRYIMDADMPTALAWLEIMGRLGFLRKHDGWSRLFDRLLDDRDRHGVWHPPRSVTMPATVPDWVWPTMPLHDSDDPAYDFGVDVTFRLGLIAKVSGRPIDIL